VWTYAGAMLLLFGASLSARGVIKMPGVRLHPEPEQNSGSVTQRNATEPTVLHS